MHDHNEDRKQDEEAPKYVADEAGRTWLEALNAARNRTERQREASMQLHEAWGIQRED